MPSPLPSIWLGRFRSADEWQAAEPWRAAVAPVFDGIDDRLLYSRHHMQITAWCAACQQTTTMAVAWYYGMVNPDGSVHPAWTETAACTRCGLGSRMRALIDYLRHQVPSLDGPVYTAERITPSYPIFETMFEQLVGSEYVDGGHASGSTHVHQPTGAAVQHQDLTALSFADAAFATVITQDVFEHIGNFTAAFAECRRVLRPGGRLVFTIPFFPDSAHTEVRATDNPDGSVTHRLPPEIHGNPMSAGGSLCYQHFGWDILHHLRGAGFADAFASPYWGPWQGHLGFPFFVFEAVAG